MEKEKEFEPGYKGIVEDPRTTIEKAQDWQHDEIAAGPLIPKWEEREPKKFPIKNQDGSSGCVAFAVAKILAIDEVFEGREYVELSPRDIYTRRKNEGGGMWLPNALDIARKHGCTLESLVPSENKGETAMNSKEGITAETDAIALKYKSAGYIEIPIDVDAIAAITSQGKGVLLGNRFDYSEWTDKPQVDPNSKRECGHGTAGVDNVLKKGTKFIVMDDSWGPRYAKFGQRYLSQEWLKARCFYAGYTMNFYYEPETNTKPKHTFTVRLRFGMEGPDVVALQDILKYEGFFPINVPSSGKMLQITCGALRKWQIKHGFHDFENEKDVRKVAFGPKSMAEANRIYS